MQSNDDLLSSLPTDGRLDGRTAIVTGSSAGIGEAVARVLASSGATVLVTARDLVRARPVADAITAAGGKAHALTLDLAGSYADLRRFAAEATDVLGGRVDVLVNNAGIYPIGPTETFADDDLDALLAVNVRAPHVLVGALAPAMAERGDGVIVNIGSWMARVGTAPMAMYPATKAALEQLTRGWAAEYGPRGVRVVGVAPGATTTRGNADYPEAMDHLAKQTPAGVPVRPVDVAYAVRFLVSDEGRFVQGSSIDVDGGIVGARVG
ncbi:SDR family NAD(P)-dependent oxidoreductase [Microlunatus antarcticus]|uniref:NAD(P)-dependent dehydrogenase (Short-subunit alcohol dehydrogenase family) n=1 Tax=Microlunatus antarcticus TaxID=53388 RepID=A0A7W5P7Q3_9ACTN|nr:SDR family oxidoreductase [Microlunatus antarcticus]MBB3327799.1 NAD(P)-dependent dehydrogenase (short-subunit alcohol dehydrogenase family) [Microlunatus antarcticus]